MSEEEAILRLNNQSIMQFWADALGLVMMFLWPSLKTITSLRRKFYRGRWQSYWVGLSIVSSVYYIFRPLLIRWKPFPAVFVAICFILSYRNGAILRAFATKIVCLVYANYFEEIHKIPDLITDLFGGMLSIPYNIISRLLGMQNRPPGVGIYPDAVPKAKTGDIKKKKRRTRTGAKTQQ